MAFKLPPNVSTKAQESAGHSADSKALPAARTGAAAYIDQLATGTGVQSPFTPTILTGADLPEDPADRLQKLRGALTEARNTAAALGARVLVRATIEAGTVLALMQRFQVHLTAGFHTFDEFVTDDLGYTNVRTAYQAISDAQNLLAVAPLQAQRRQTIVASQAAVLAPWMQSDEGVERARKALDQAASDSPNGRVTAAGLRKALGTPRQAKQKDETDAEARARVDAAYESAAEHIEAILTTLSRVQSAGVPPLDSARAERAVSRIRAGGRRLDRTTKMPG
ncbi:hypothetical protein AB0L54_33075 [Streptomyces sp. NPDC052196]|uniref:hypothetical protein n=1 Tax=Streptomyces sp. NPDC052196 TaxID=3156691 RepID=UPI003427B555